LRRYPYYQQKLGTLPCSIPLLWRQCLVVHIRGTTLRLGISYHVGWSPE
jgi:hypothetical protein